MARPVRKPPAQLAHNRPNEPATEVTVEVARSLALRLREVMDGRSAREVGRLAGVDFTTVSAILNGTTWPDLMTLARLEAGLGTDLWPQGVASRGGSTTK